MWGKVICDLLPELVEAISDSIRYYWQYLPPKMLVVSLCQSVLVRDTIGLLTEDEEFLLVRPFGCAWHFKGRCGDGSRMVTEMGGEKCRADGRVNGSSGCRGGKLSMFRGAKSATALTRMMFGDECNSLCRTLLLGGQLVC